MIGRSPLLPPRIRLWIVVLLVVFLALCGVHLMGSHHHGEPDGLALALAMATALILVLIKKSVPVGFLTVDAPSGLARFLLSKPHGRPPIRAPLRI